MSGIHIYNWHIPRSFHFECLSKIRPHQQGCTTSQTYMVQSGYNKQGVHIYMTRGDYNSINQGFHPFPKVPQYARRGNSCQDETKPTMLRFHNSVKKQFQLYNAIKLPICLYEEARIVWSLEQNRTNSRTRNTDTTHADSNTHTPW